MQPSLGHQGAPSFRVLTLGPAVPPGPFSFAVHSTFDSAVNLRPDGSDILLTLTGPAGAGLPGSIVLDSEGDARSLGCEPGQRGDFDSKFLRIVIGGRSTIIPAENARRREAPALTPIRHIGSAYGIARAELSRIRRSLGEGDWLDSIFDPQARSISSAPANTVRNLAALPLESPQTRAAMIRRVVDSLVGFGRGLTPSGDDFLCGFLAATRACGSTLAGEIAAAIEAATPLTTEISASYLRFAVRGFHEAALADLVRSIARDDGASSVSALRELCERGHSSGADVATGLLVGLDRFAAAKTTSCHIAQRAQRRQHAS